MLKGLNSVILQKTLDNKVAIYNQKIDIKAGIKVCKNSSNEIKASNSASMNYIQPNNVVKTLEGFLPEFNKKDNTVNTSLYDMYEDIYLHDAICGGAVDFLSTLPFGNFRLSCKRKENEEIFNACIEKLQLKELLPLLVSDYFIYGAYIGSLHYNSSLKYFDYLATHRIQDCQLEYPPVENVEPIISAKVSCPWANSSEEKYEEWREKIPEYLQTNGIITLAPASTLYLYRNTSATQQRGVSLFDRVLLVCLFEKFLLRGTVTRAGRRIAPITHIKVGSDTHVPLDEELRQYAELFAAADADPVDATIVTREDVDITDIKNGTDFWKWDDIFEIATSAKYRALGISEDLLNGNTTIANMEANMSFLLKKEEKVRESVVNQIFNHKIFEAIAVVNKMKVNSDTGIKIGNSYYDIPAITWEDNLKPQTDDRMLDMLDKLADKGVPVPLRMYAAAGNVDMDKILQMLTEDEELRKELGMESSEEDSSDEEFDFNASENKELKASRSKWLHNPFRRNYDTEFNKKYYGVHDRDTSGKIRYENGDRQKQLEKLVNKKIVEEVKKQK